MADAAPADGAPAPAAAAQQPAPNTYDLAGARAAGVPDSEIATLLAPLHGYDLAGARAAGVPDSEIADLLGPMAITPPAPPPEQTSATGAFAHAAAEEAAPAAGAFGGFVAGAELGGGIGGALGGPPGAFVGGLGGGLIGSYLAARGVGAAQQTAISALPPDVQRAIGEAPEQVAARAAQHPIATFAGAVAPNLLFMRPGGVEAAAANAPAFAKFMANPITARVVPAGISAAQEAVEEGEQGQGYDPTKLAIAAGAGAALNREWLLGRPLSGAGAAMAARLATLPSPRSFVPPAATPDAAVADILSAGNVDDSIAAAEDLARRQTPIDVGQVAGDLDAGEPGDQQQAKLLRMFDSLGNGTVEHDGSGGYQFRTVGADGNEVTQPIAAWDPNAPPADGAQPTIAPDIANAIRDHYAKFGIDTVFYRDDSAAPGAEPLPFDGTFDPKQPNTIFVSSDPVRGAAQVAAHEFTHALADTTLPPDPVTGEVVNLGDLLNRQIAASITPAGQAYAQRTFAPTAPQRAAFPAGPEGDAVHAAAVQAHYVNELGADIGAEAPKFQTFLPRVIDAVQARFGNTVAGDVLSKLIGGLRTAMDTVRGLFGDTTTESQNWVTNIGAIHDTLAQMYAERFGSPAERLQAQLDAVRDRAARDALVAAPPTALEGVSEVAPPPAAPGTPEAAQAHDALTAKALKERRWATELSDEQKAAVAPQVTLLAQTEQAILRPVGGDATALPPPQAARLEAVRAQLDALTNQPDSPAVARVKDELAATVAQRRGVSPYTPMPRAQRAPVDAVRYLAAHGGIRPDADLTAMGADKVAVPFVGKLVRPDGMSLNAAREQLHALGYPLVDPTDDRSIYSLIDEHISGRPTYAGGDQAQALERQNIRAHNAEIDRLAAEHGIDPAGKTYAEFFDAVTRATDATAEAHEVVEAEADREGFARVAPGWGDEDSASLSLEDLENEYRQTEAAETLGRDEEGAGRSQPAADREVPGEAGGGQGVRGAGAGRGAAEGEEPTDVAFSPRPPRNVGGQGDIFRGEQPEPERVGERAPTIRGDVRQIDMFGTADAAVQAQAARDQAGRGGLLPRGEQRAADEGLFAPKAPKGGTLFSPRRTEPVSRITGDEIAPRSASLGALRYAARQFYQNVLRKTSVRSEALGRDVQFMGSRKAFHTSANPDKLRLFASLRDVIAKGELVSSEAPRDPSAEPSTRAYHFLTAPVELGGRRVEVGVTVREDANGHLYYNHTPLEDAGGPGLRPAGTRRKGGPGSEGETTYDRQVGATGDDVNLQVGPAGEGGADRSGKVVPAAGTGGDSSERSAPDVGLSRDQLPGDRSGPTPEANIPSPAEGESPKGDVQFSPRREEDRPRLYSALQRGVEGLKLDKAPPGQWLSTIKNLAGVKPEELRWSGVEDWLKQQPKSVTRAEVLDYLRANALDVREVMRGGTDAARAQVQREVEALGLDFHNASMDSIERAGGSEDLADRFSRYVLGDARNPSTKFGQFTLPGGENYRELLLTLPKEQFERPVSDDPFAQVPFAQEYRSPHWEEPNVLAHVRFDDRVAPDGKRTLLVHEVQSDWHQAGRKQGYSSDIEADKAKLDALNQEYERQRDIVTEANNRDDQREVAAARAQMDMITDQMNAIHDRDTDRRLSGQGIPDAPFKTTWPALVMKRIIKYAVDHGYDRVAWAPGDVQADRYDLSKQVRALHYDKTAAGYLLAPETHEGREVPVNNGLPVPENKLADYVGKDVADKIIRGEGEGTPGGVKTLSGFELKIGGEGMRAFYDKMLPAEVNKIAGKFGGKVGRNEVPVSYEDRDQVKPDAQAQADHAAEWQRVISTEIEPYKEAASGYSPQREEASQRMTAGYEHLDRIHAQMIDETMARGTTQPVHSLDINPAMQRAVQAEGLPLFSPRTPRERPGASATEVEEARQPGRREEDVSALIDAVAAERGGIMGTGTPPTDADRVLSRVAELGDKAIKNKNLNGLEEHQTIFPRTMATLDTRSADYYRAFMARETEGTGNLHDLRAVIDQSMNKLPAASRDRVAAALELARKWNVRPTDPSLPLRVRNNSYWQARWSKVGDDYVLTPAETRAFHDMLRLGDEGWAKFATALVRREGWRGDADPVAIEAAANAAGLRLPEGKRLMRLATALRAIQAQGERPYFPAMRFGDVFVSVTPKISPDVETTSVIMGRPETQWFETVERGAGRDVAGWNRLRPDEMPEVRDVIAALGKRPDNTGQPAFGEFTNTSPGVWESATHRLETGDLSRTPDILRRLNIPAIEKLFMLMERHATSDMIEKVLAEHTPEEGLSPREAAQLKRRTARYGSGSKLVGGEAYERYQELLGATKDTLLDALYNDLLAGWKKQAKLTPGYSADMERAIGTHMGQVARNTADMVHREAIDRTFQEVAGVRDERGNFAGGHPNAAVARYWRAFQQDQDNPHSLLSRAAASAGQVGTVWAMALNPASTLKIALHNVLMGAPVMSVGVGMGRAAAELARATADVYRQASFDMRRGASIDAASVGRTPGERAFIAEQERIGATHARGADDIRQLDDRQASLWGTARPLMRRAMDIALSNVSMVDRANRLTVGLAAYRVAQDNAALALAARPLMRDNALFRAEVEHATEQNMRAQVGGDMATAQAAAIRSVYPRFMVDQAAGQWGRSNQAPAMRGTEGAMFFKFRGYQTRYLSTALNLMKNSGREGKAAAAWMMLGLAAVTGVYGLPFIQDIEKGGDAFWKWLGHEDPQIDAHIRQWLGDAGLSKIGADYLLRGPASVLSGTDTPSSMGFGDLLSRPMSPADLLGVVPSMLWDRLSAAYSRESTGQGAAAAAAEVLPAALRNPAEAAIQAREGVISPTGEMVQPAARITGADVAKRALGFTPLDLAQTRSRAESDYATTNATEELRHDVERSYAVLHLRASIADHNGDHSGADALRAEANQMLTDHRGLMITQQGLKDAEFQLANPELFRLTHAPMRVRQQIQNSPYP